MLLLPACVGGLQTQTSMNLFDMDTLDSIENKDTIESKGLTVSFNQETSEITFEWDPDTHPEFNYLNELSAEDIHSTIMKHFADIVEQANEDQTTEESNVA